MSEKVKILFRLSQDDDGYPPVAVEGVWASRTSNGHFVIDNIPFFATDATLGDVIATTKDEERIWFSQIVTCSSNSLLRVILFDAARVDEVRAQLAKLGCDTEVDHSGNLISVHVPECACLRSVQAYLQTESLQGYLDYEEPILRQ